jgi:hypothetical protein
MALSSTPWMLCRCEATRMLIAAEGQVHRFVECVEGDIGAFRQMVVLDRPERPLDVVELRAQTSP